MGCARRWGHRIVTTIDRRRVGVGLVALTLLALGAGCGGSEKGGTVEVSPPARNNPTGTVPQPDVEFRADVNRRDDAITVTYRLTNNGDATLVVPNLLPEAAGAGVAYRAGRLWATDVENDVLLSLAFFDRPDVGDRMNWAQTPVVGVSVIAPGKTLSGEASAPVPLQWRHPWGDDFGDGTLTLPAEPEQINFCLGVAPQKGLTVVSREDGVEVVGQDTEQSLLCTDTVDFAALE